MITGAFFIFAILISSTLIHFAEKSTGVESFSSIISSFWWSVVTFTTVGYGGSYPITALGKIVASFSATIDVAIHGLIFGIIGSAFLIHLIKNRKHIQKKSHFLKKILTELYI